MKLKRNQMVQTVCTKRYMKTLSGVVLLGVLCLILGTYGCATTTPVVKRNNAEIMKKYLTQIDKSDGIDQDEALLLARSQIIFRGKDARYDLDKPRLSSEKDEWVLTFSPVNKTLGEVISSTDLIIRISKRDGRIDWIEQE